MLGAQDMNLVFLPLAHSYAKAIEVAIFYTGIPSAIDGSLDGFGDGSSDGGDGGGCGGGD